MTSLHFSNIEHVENEFNTPANEVAKNSTAIQTVLSLYLRNKNEKQCIIAE